MDAEPLGATVVVGFAEAIPAPEVVWSLVDEGFEVIAFARKGRSSALRHSRHVVCHEICAPETDVQAALSDLKSLLSSIKKGGASPQQVLLPLDDKALFLCSQLQIDDGWLLAGAEGAHAELALSKYVQIQLAKAAGFNIPATALARTSNEVRDFAAASSYPVILKSANCILIEDGKVKSCPHWICANAEELESALASWAGRVPLLVQPFIEGTGEGIFGLADPRWSESVECSSPVENDEPSRFRLECVRFAARSRGSQATSRRLYQPNWLARNVHD